MSKYINLIQSYSSIAIIGSTYFYANSVGFSIQIKAVCFCLLNLSAFCSRFLSYQLGILHTVLKIMSQGVSLLVPNLSWKALSFSLSIMMLSVGFSYLHLLLLQEPEDQGGEFAVRPCLLIMSEVIPIKSHQMTQTQAEEGQQ